MNPGGIAGLVIGLFIGIILLMFVFGSFSRSSYLIGGGSKNSFIALIFGGIIAFVAITFVLKIVGIAGFKNEKD